MRLRSFPFGTVVRLEVPVETDGAPLIRALLVDDEAPARSELRFLLAEHTGVQVVGEAAGASEALDLARDLAPDVVFLDVEMPGLSGVAAAPLVRERTDPPAVVFVTAHERYAVEAFAVEAFDYLLKPVDPDRLARVVERLRERSVESVAARREGARRRRRAAPSCSTTTRFTSHRPTATTAACTPTTARISAPRRSASSRRSCPRPASRASTARTSSI